MRTIIANGKLNLEYLPGHNHIYYLNPIESEGEVKKLDSTPATDIDSVLERLIGDGVKKITVAGGDGTINEVVNGICNLKEKPNITLGILPYGTGNDTCLNLGIRTMDIAMKIFNDSDYNKTKNVDILEVEIPELGLKIAAVNVADGSFGSRLSAKVGQHLTYKRILKKWAYDLGVLWTYPFYKLSSVQFEYKGERREYENVALLAIMNGNVAAGDLLFAQGKNDDGLFDMTLAHNFQPGFEGLRKDAIPLLSKAQKHDVTMFDQSNVEYFPDNKEISINMDGGPYFNVDGEVYITGKFSTINCKILRQIPIYVP